MPHEPVHRARIHRGDVLVVAFDASTSIERLAPRVAWIEREAERCGIDVIIVGPGATVDVVRRPQTVVTAWEALVERLRARRRDLAMMLRLRLWGGERHE